MVTRSKKVFKACTHSEIDLHESQIPKLLFASLKTSVKNSKQFEKNDEVLGGVIKN